MRTIAERLDYVIRKLGITDRELARRSGLAESHISLMKRRLQGAPGAVQLGTLTKVAEGAGVSLQWLIFGTEGEGIPHDPAVNRAGAAVAARATGVWEHAVRSVLLDEVTPEQCERSQAWWMMRMVMREEEMVDEATRRRLVREARQDAPPAVSLERPVVGDTGDAAANDAIPRTKR